MINTLKMYPPKLRDSIKKSVRMLKVAPTAESYNKKILFISLVISIISLLLFYVFQKNLLWSLTVFFGLFIFFLARLNLMASTRIKKMENVFPDVISLMSSNLKSGMTIDRSFVLSARKEFAPLDEEILLTGKDIATGVSVTIAMKRMGDRISSEKIKKTLMLLVSGINAGGNVSDLLEQTAANMREKEFVEKRAASNVLMYVIFIFFAIGVGAPVLFALSSILVEVIISIAADIPEVDTAQFSTPVSFNEIGITPSFVIYFAIIFLIVTDLLSSLIIGMINKGDSKSGLRYFLPLIAFSLSVFFSIRWILRRVLADLFTL